jgi:hypothetical protein
MRSSSKLAENSAGINSIDWPSDGVVSSSDVCAYAGKAEVAISGIDSASSNKARWILIFMPSRE